MTEEAKARCDRSKAIRRANRGVIMKLTREVNKLINVETLSEATLVRLRVTFRQLEAKQLTLNDLDREILSLCELAEVEGEIDESETILARIIECKGKLESVLQPPHSITTEVTMDTSHSETVSSARAAKTRLPN